MNIFRNTMWLTFGGGLIAFEYFVVGLIFCCTIVGIPFGFQAFKLGVFVLLPFGRRCIVVEQEEQQYWLVEMMTLLWIVVGGVWIALTHVALFVCLAVSVVGLPFAMLHLRLVPMAFSPFGRNVVRG